MSLRWQWRFTVPKMNIGYQEQQYPEFRPISGPSALMGIGHRVRIQAYRTDAARSDACQSGSLADMG